MVALHALQESAQQAGQGGVRQILTVWRAGDVQPRATPTRGALADRLRERTLADAHAPFDLDNRTLARLERRQRHADLLHLALAAEVALQTVAPHATGLTQHDITVNRLVLAADA